MIQLFNSDPIKYLLKYNVITSKNRDIFKTRSYVLQYGVKINNPRKAPFLSDQKCAVHLESC